MKRAGVSKCKIDFIYKEREDVHLNGWKVRIVYSHLARGCEVSRSLAQAGGKKGLLLVRFFLLKPRSIESETCR